jgi:hypothetical protein
MTTEQKVIKNKVGLLTLAQTLGNVSQRYLYCFGGRLFFSLPLFRWGRWDCDACYYRETVAQAGPLCATVAGRLFAYLMTKIGSSSFVLWSIFLIVTVQSCSEEPPRPSELNCILYLWGSVKPSTARKSSKSSVRV